MVVIYSLQKNRLSDMDISFHPKQAYVFNSPATEILFGGSAGPGKGGRLDDLVLTPFGWKKYRQLKVGDAICATDGTVQKIIGYYPKGKQEVYKLTWSDGSETIVDSDHIWLAWVTGKSRKIDNVPVNGEASARKWTTKEIYEFYQRDIKRKNRIAIPIISKPCAFSVHGENAGPKKHIKRSVEPYLLGVLLGDGCLRNETVTFCTPDYEIVDNINHILEDFYNCDKKLNPVNKSNNNKAKLYTVPKKLVYDDLVDLGVYGCLANNKFIPRIYLFGSVNDRWALLQGLMDTDGTVDKNGDCYFTTVSKQLADDVRHLARSLGAIVSLNSKIPFYTYKGERRKGQKAYTLRIKIPEPQRMFRVNSKAARCNNKQHQSMGLYLNKIEPAGQCETVCISVSHPNSLYITNDFIITHNSHLMRIAAIMWCAEIPGLQVYLFRRTYPELWKNHMEGPKGFFNLLSDWIDQGHAKINTGKGIITFWNNSKIFLCHCQHEKDRMNYHGSEIHLLLVDELTMFTKTIYTYLRSRVRAPGLVLPDKYKDRFPRIINSSNPGGIGHNWVKADFVNIAQPNTIIRMPKKEGGMLRQFVPAFLSDNPTMMIDDPDYKDRLSGLGDPELVRAMLEGDWDIVSGGMFDDVWDRSVHVIEPFKIPNSWYIDRSFDWGSSRPFSVGWWAESDGTEAILRDGTKKTWPAKTLFRIGEWYGWKKGEPNVGLKMNAKDIAKGIIEREKMMGIRGRVKPGPADSSIYDSQNDNCIADDMRTAGVKWTEANKSSGSRVSGWELLRTRLAASLEFPMEEPGLFVFNTCNDGFIRTVPVLPRAEKNREDVDTDAEDHVGDETRYRLLGKKPATVKEIKVLGT